MPKKYDPDVKKRFLAVARRALSQREPIETVLELARAAGYEGAVAGLRKMVYGTNAGKQRRAPRPSRTQRPIATKRSTGGRSPSVAPERDLASIAALIEREVARRVKDAKGLALEAFLAALGSR